MCCWRGLHAGRRRWCIAVSHAADTPAAPPLLLQGGGEGGGKQEEEVELPFPSIPHPDYEAEQPQEQTPPEPENPLPAGLPPNHPDEVRKLGCFPCICGRPLTTASMHMCATRTSTPPPPLLPAGSQGPPARGADAPPRARHAASVPARCERPGLACTHGRRFAAFAASARPAKAAYAINPMLRKAHLPPAQLPLCPPPRSAPRRLCRCPHRSRRRSRRPPARCPACQRRQSSSPACPLRCPTGGAAKSTSHERWSWGAGALLPNQRHISSKQLPQSSMIAG